MKTTKIVLAVVFSIVCIGMSWGQQRVIYGYDAAGNRVTRDFEPLENIYEYGTITLTQDTEEEWSPAINFINTYTNPVVVMGPPSYNGADESTLRIKDVTTNSFKCQLDEWENLDGAHTEEQFSYLVVEAGVHKFGDLLVQAGIIENVNYSIYHGYDFSHASFSPVFDNTPVILSQIVTYNNESNNIPSVTRIYNATEQLFDITIQPSENHISVPETEDVAYIAIEPGSTLLEDTYVFEADHTGDYVSSSWYNISYSSMNNPAFLAQIQTFDAMDPAGLRYRNLTNNSVEVFCEEEQTHDNEKIHTDENVGYLLIENTQIQQKKLQLEEPIAFTDTTRVIQQDSIMAQPSSADDIHIYPNPNNGKFTIEIHDDFWNGGTARVCTQDGSVITTFSIHTNRYEYTIPNATPGHYVVQFYKGKKQYSRIITVE
jgi:hypothetical protein